MNRLLNWWRRRRDENDVHVHPDTGRLGSPVRHRAPVRGARVALKQIEAELAVAPGLGAAAAMTEFYATPHRYLETTIPGLRRHAERCLTRAANAESKIRDLMDQISDLTDLAARERQEADDHFRAAALVELDVLAPAQAAGWPQAPWDEDYPPPEPEPLLPWEQELLDTSTEPPPEREAERAEYVRWLERSMAAVAVDEPTGRVGEVLDERMHGMGAPTAESAAPWWRPEPFPWLPGPADVPGARDGDTHTMPAYQHTGSAR